MKVIVALGNPGKKYEKTRHNTGFLVMDKLLEELKITLDHEKFNSLYTIYKINEETVILCKPLTYMNNSGEAVKPLLNYFKATADDLIVVHDDLDLPVGKIRIRKSGSSGGQNGMKNIIELLNTSEIKRIRVGIGKDKDIDVINYVLGKTNKEDLPLYEEALNKAKDALIFSFDHDFDLVMNRFNQ